MIVYYSIKDSCRTALAKQCLLNNQSNEVNQSLCCLLVSFETETDIRQQKYSFYAKKKKKKEEEKKNELTVQSKQLVCTF